MTPDSRESLLPYILSEVIKMASAIGGMREAQRATEQRHAALEARLNIVETTILQTSSRMPPREKEAKWWRLLLPTAQDTIGKMLILMTPRLLFIGALMWKWIEKGAAWLWHALF